MSGRTSRVIQFMLTVDDDYPCDSNNDGLLDEGDAQLNAYLTEVDALPQINSLIANAIESQDLVVVVDPRGWSGTYTKAVLDIFPATALQSDCIETAALDQNQPECPYFIPSKSLNYHGCATTGIHGVEYGLAGTPMASVPANVLLTPPLFGLSEAVLFLESRLQGVIEDDGSVPTAYWCGSIDMEALVSRVDGACNESTHALCDLLTVLVASAPCDGMCTLSFKLSTRGVSSVVKGNWE